jgi:regulatory protein
MLSGVVTALEVQKRNKQRVNVYLDGEYAFSLPIDEAAKLRKGQPLSEADIRVMQDEDDRQRAVDSAARFLSYRPRSTHEVRQNLARKGIDSAVIDAAVERLLALGYLDDAAFAAFWVRERCAFKPIARRALRHELRQKGIADSVIDEALAQVDENETVYRAAEAQARKLRGSTRQAFEAKLSGFLQRRGFSYSDIRTAIQQLTETLETEDGFFAETNHDDSDYPPPAPEP